MKKQEKKEKGKIIFLKTFFNFFNIKIFFIVVTFVQALNEV